MSSFPIVLIQNCLRDGESFEFNNVHMRVRESASVRAQAGATESESESTTMTKPAASRPPEAPAASSAGVSRDLFLPATGVAAADWE